jgi:hypothetical protein
MQWHELTVRELFEDVIGCSNYEGLDTAAPESTASSSFHVLTLIIEIHRPEVIELVKTLVSLSQYRIFLLGFVYRVFQNLIHSSKAC